MDSYFVLTGAPGSGKTTILNILKTLGLAAVEEPARQILAEQRAIGGRGLPETDAGLFTRLLLSRALYDHRRLRGAEGPLLFDRGLPDIVGYAELFGLATAEAAAAARSHRYNETVFLAPALPEIYCQDDERRMTFAEARDFGALIRCAYEDQGYRIVELPAGPAEARARFILAEMMAILEDRCLSARGAPR